MHAEQKYLPQKLFKENGPRLSCDLGFPGGSDRKKKNLPAMQETGVRFLSQEDSLEKGMATRSYSCLENCMDRGAWWATVRGVAKRRTRRSD